MNKKEMLRAKIERFVCQMMDEEPVTVRPDDRLGDVLARMTERTIDPREQGRKEIEGLVSYGTMLRRKNLSTEAKSTIMVSRPVPPDGDHRGGRETSERRRQSSWKMVASPGWCRGATSSRW